MEFAKLGVGDSTDETAAPNSTGTERDAAPGRENAAPCYGGIKVRRKGLSPGRLEAISDGVIAVIITIMVLELKVPGPDGIAGLRAVLPAIFLYLLTFVQIGIYWVNHHYLVDEVETVSHGILWANLMFLFCLSLFPFATDWIGVKGAVVVYHRALRCGEHFAGARIYGAVGSDPIAEYGAGARNLGQADRVGSALSHSDTHGLLPACCLSGPDRYRCGALAAAAEGSSHP
jgi:hypothetical protein